MADRLCLITVDFPNPLVERLRVVSSHLRIEVHPVQTVMDLPEEILSEAEILYTDWGLPDPASVPNLQWIQLHFAGVDHIADHPLLDSQVMVTTLSGAAASQMGEYALMGMLALGKRVLRMLEDKRDKRWPEDRFTRFTPVELRGSTVGIVGYGSVGREVARLCVHFGAKVLATKRDLKYLIDEGYMPEGLGDPRAELFERLYPPQALQSMVSMCDFVVITVPLTQETRGLIDKHVFSSMKPTAFLIDISRGGVVEHADLIEALQSEQIAGAVIDVFSKEPLPEESPLWEIPNVILSPHIAGASAHYQERAADLFLENLGRYMLGEPLLNRYHPQHGY